MDLTFDSNDSFILGSASPRRQQLLRDAGFRFRVVSIDADESFSPHLQAEEIPLYLAQKKAGLFPEKLKEKDVLLTADTIVWVENTVLNKPKDVFEASQMLRFLSGKMHQVFTGVCIRSLHKQISFFDETRVYFKEFTDQEIDFYIEQFKPFDKAGSYGAQDWLGLIGIERIEGSYFNVMGLPVHKVYSKLKEF